MHIIYISLYIITIALYTMARLSLSTTRYDDLADADKEQFAFECLIWPITVIMYLFRR